MLIHHFSDALVDLELATSASAIDPLQGLAWWSLMVSDGGGRVLGTVPALLFNQQLQQLGHEISPLEQFNIPHSRWYSAGT
jgi:hypothetical protein